MPVAYLPHEYEVGDPVRVPGVGIRRVAEVRLRQWSRFGETTSEAEYVLEGTPRNEWGVPAERFEEASLDTVNAPGDKHVTRVPHAFGLGDLVRVVQKGRHYGDLGEIAAVNVYHSSAEGPAVSYIVAPDPDHDFDLGRPVVGGTDLMTDEDLEPVARSA